MSSPSCVKSKWLTDACEKMIDNCISLSGDITRLVNQTIDFGQISQGPFACRHAGCKCEYVYHSGRVK